MYRRFLVRVKNVLSKLIRKIYLKKRKRKIKNTTLSVFASNCVGACVLHDLGIKFNSPFVNLYLDAKDYIKYLHDPDKYNKMDFEKIESTNGYPMGKLGDLIFHFQHYKSFDEAVDSFKRRCKRINYENLYVIFSERDGCTYEDLKEFDALPYKNKIVLTHLPYDEIKSSVYISGYEENDGLGYIFDWDKKLGKKIYDRFDFLGWFNGDFSVGN